MALALIPDLEDVVGDHLRNHPDIVALDAKVVGTSLGASTAPWVRVSILDAPRIGPIDHLVDTYMQFDCFSGTNVAKSLGAQAQVNLLARTVRAVLNDLPNTDFDDVVVTGVNVNRGPRMADDTVEPAREHIPVTVSIYSHP